MVVGVVARQLQPLGGQPGPVVPQPVLQEGRAGLGLTDVQVNTRSPGPGDLIILAGGGPARAQRDLNVTSDPDSSTGFQ
jgi:hypothetical protein